MRQRVLRHPLDSWVDPAAAFVALYGDDTDVFWLDDSLHSTAGMSAAPMSAAPISAAPMSYMGRASRVVTSMDTDVLRLLRDDMPRDRGEGAVPRFELGWVGWLGYELRSSTMREPHSRTSRYPDAALLFVDRAVEFDHASREARIIALGDSWTEELSAWRDDVTMRLRDAGAPKRAAQLPPGGTVTWAYSDNEYLGMIAACQRAIVAGDAYQLCLTTEAATSVRPDPLAAYLELRESSPTHHGALLRVGPVSVLSASPEQFLTVSPSGIVTSSPIKGTRRRGESAQADAALREELESSDKERAENLMIVDLMRNDIARVSEIGTVEVTSLLSVESYAHVHQLVSTIRGRLAAGRNGIDAVEACFPAGSMTGAPKLSATRILDRIEERARGVYSGALGYFSTDGSIDLSMVIRTIVIDDSGATVGTGGGITALSVPHDELEEARLKAAALLAVLGVHGG